MVKISIICATARPDYPMIDLPEVHQFTPLLESLEKQTFTDFELIISDVFHKKRSYDFSKYSFPVKHIDPNEFSWALKKGLWALQDGFNWGLVHAEGELLLWFGDCCELVNNDSLQIWWDWYLKGFYALALVVYYKGNQPFLIDEAIEAATARARAGGGTGAEDIKKLVEEGYMKNVLRDSRWKYVEDSPNGVFKCGGSLFYGYSSSSLDDMLKVNGYDSNFDGSRALTDVECGLRLERLGCQFVLDKRLWLVERAHQPILAEVLWGTPEKGCFRSNYSLMILNQRKKRVKANDYRLTKEELEWIVEHGTYWSIPRPEEGSYRHQQLMDWYNNPPMYDLRTLRLEHG